MLNYYDILNISYNASTEDVKKAFRKLVKRYHPDLASKDERQKLHVIMQAYETLSDEYKRNLYDYEVYSTSKIDYDKRVIVPLNRVKYSRGLRDLAASGLLRKKFKKRDIRYHFKHDIDIFITPSECLSGCFAVFELPVRKLCPYCRGSDRRCYFCDGIGRVNSTQPLEVGIPPNIKDGEIIEIDLLKTCKVKFASFRMSKIVIKINIIGKKIGTAKSK